MTFLLATDTSWALPGCPQPPDWSLDWAGVRDRYNWLGELAGTPQDPQHHGEGDVLTHTGMVAEALVALPAWHALPAPSRSVLFAAALFHDVAKPRCTVVDERGRIASQGHARRGEQMARSMLWRDAPRYGGVTFAHREHVAKLVRHHGLPLWFLDKADPERALITASQSVRLDDVALLAEADVRGRICADGDELLARIELFRQLAVELDCFQQPRPFASAHSHFVYFQNPAASLHYNAYDTTSYEVILMSGLPGVGKDTWVRQHAAHLACISLDAIRKELGIAPGEPSGPVVRAAKERARSFLQRGEPFVWNATNITRSLRRQLIGLFTDYGARVRVVYLDAPYATILARNRNRPDPVPEHIINRLLVMLDLPDPTEAHTVEYMESL